jgi:hypothetical protein
VLALPLSYTEAGPLYNAAIMEPQFRFCTSADGFFFFADRGEFVAKGFGEPVRLYEVRWQASD